MTTANSRFVSVLLMAMFIFVCAEDLFVLATEENVAACPHHTSPDECMMDMCPIKTQEHGENTRYSDAPVSVSCPPDDTSLLLHSRMVGETISPASFVPATVRTKNLVYISAYPSDRMNPPLERPPNS